MTANAQPGAREEYLAAGMNGYVSKPISPAALLEVLAKFQPLGTTAAKVDNSPASDIALLDRSVIAALEKAMSPAGLQGFMTLFVEDSLAHMDTIADGIAASDFESVARAAHNLVSSAGNVGAVRMSALARALDHAARAEDAASTTEQAAALKAVREETLGALRALRPFDQAVA